MPFEIVRNDITKVKADAIVNTANPNPICVSGTDLAIYEAAENLQKMVCEVNASCVSAEEKLSDSVYYYNLQTKNVELV